LKLFHKIGQSEYLRHIGILTSGVVIAQAITIVTAPVLTRIYHPVDYDVLGIYMMVTGIIGALVTLQYQNVIIITDDEEEAKAALFLCIAITGIFTLITLVLTLMLFPFFPGWFGNQEIKYWMLATPFSIFFAGWNTAFVTWANRKKKYKLLSFNRIFGAVLIPSFSISLGLIWMGPGGLMIGLLIGQVIPAIMLSYHFLKPGELRISFPIKQFKVIARKYSSLPKYSLPSEFINTFITYLPVMLFATSYQVSGAIGNFNLSNRMLALPVTLISGSVLEVFRQKASAEYHEQGTCRHSYLQTTKLLVLCGFVPFAVLMAAGPWIFATVFGPNWEMAGKFSQIMAPLFFFRFMVNPLSYVFFIAGKQREDLLAHFAMIVLVLISFGISAFFNFNFYWALAAYSIAFCIIYFYYLVRSYQFSIGK